MVTQLFLVQSFEVRILVGQLTNKINKMSKTKFNGFEKWFITTALKNAIEEAEENIIELEREGKRPIYASGYFEMVGKELIAKVHNMTLKRDQ